MKYPKLILAHVDTIPTDPDQAGYVLHKLVTATVGYLKEIKIEAGIFTVDFNLLSNVTDSIQLLRMPVTPIFLGLKKYAILQGTVNGVTGVYASQHFLLVTNEGEYSLLQGRKMEEFAVFDSVTNPEDIDLNNIDDDVLEEVRESTFKDLENAYNNFKNMPVEEEDKLTSEQIEEIKNQFGTDLPVVDESDEDLLED